jgi:hypothetical protein
MTVVLKKIITDCKGHICSCETIDIAEQQQQQSVTFVHEQSAAAAIWTIRHPLFKYASVSVLDSANTQIFGIVKYISLSEISVSFTTAISGKAVLN